MRSIDLELTRGVPVIRQLNTWSDDECAAEITISTKDSLLGVDDDLIFWVEPFKLSFESG